MGLNTETRIQKLENEVKALKATYMLSGGLMRVYESISPVYSFSIITDPPIIIKFTSDFVTSQPILVASVVVVEELSNGITGNYSAYTVTQIQSGDGNIIIQPAFTIGTISVQIKLVATSPGTFTRIA